MSKVLRAVLLITLMLGAWFIGHVQGQSSVNDAFLITIDAPGGKTTVECAKGCSDRARQQEFACTGARCRYTFNQDGFTRR